MKNIIFILLLAFYQKSFSQQPAVFRLDSAGRVGFCSNIKTAVTLNQDKFNKVVSWFSSCSSNSAGNIYISLNNAVRFKSTAIHCIKAPEKFLANTVRYDLSVSLNENLVILAVKNFVFFADNNQRMYRNKNRYPLLTGMQQSLSMSTKRSKNFYHIADSLANNHVLMLAKSLGGDY